MAVEAVGLAHATAQQHPVDGMPDALLGNRHKKPGCDPMTTYFVSTGNKPHRTQRIGNNRCATAIQLLYLNLAAQLLGLV